MSLSLKTCYRQNGLTAVGDVPCDPNAQDSTCCGPQSVCVQNLYCRNQYGSSVPGTCTDQTWGVRGDPNPACPCPPYYKTDNSTLNYIDSVTFCSDGSVCCGMNNNDCCSSGKGNPVIFYGNTAAIPSGTQGLSSYYANAKASTSPVTRSSSSGTGHSTATSTAHGPGTAANGGDGISLGAKVGIGIGGVLVGLLLIIGALFIFVWVPRKRYAKLGTAQAGQKKWVEPYRHEAPVAGQQLIEMGSDKSRPSELGMYR